jgi:signal transduction histidine kinase
MHALLRTVSDRHRTPTVPHMNAMSVVLFASTRHPDLQALVSALEAGVGPTHVALSAKEAFQAWEAAPRSLLLLDLRGGDEEGLQAAQSLRKACSRARSLCLLPTGLGPAPEADGVLRPPIFLDEVVRWCSRASLGPLGEEILADMAAGLSHEIGNPLTSLLLQIELLKADPSLKKVAEHLTPLEESARRIQTVVEDVTRAALRQPVRVNDIRLEQFLKQTSQCLGERSPELMDKLEITCEDTAIHVDGGLLSGALADVWEYLFRAGEGHETLSVKGAAVASGPVRIRHRAHTPRLPTDAAARLFTPLWARQALGLPEGLSLTTARNAFRRHGGDMRARSDGEQLIVEAILPATTQTSLSFKK